MPNIWLRPPGATQRRDADAAKALLTVPDGDHLTLLNVYNQYILSEHRIVCSLLTLSNTLYLARYARQELGME